MIKMIKEVNHRSQSDMQGCMQQKAINSTVEGVLPIVAKLVGEVVDSISLDKEGKDAYSVINDIVNDMKKSHQASENDLIDAYQNTYELKERFIVLRNHDTKWTVDKLLAENIPGMKQHIYVENPGKNNIERIPREWYAEALSSSEMESYDELQAAFSSLRKEIKKTEASKEPKPVTEADHYIDATSIGGELEEHSLEVITFLTKQWSKLSEDQKVAAAAILLHCSWDLVNTERFDNYITPRQEAFSSMLKG